jgi:hypothetical protein
MLDQEFWSGEALYPNLSNHNALWISGGWQGVFFRPGAGLPETPFSDVDPGQPETQDIVESPEKITVISYQGQKLPR